jgi:hypothetical protein
MKYIIYYTILLIFCWICTLFFIYHKVNEKTPCNAHSYQIETYNEGIGVWDGDRYVGECSYDKLDSLILKDNQ